MIRQHWLRRLTALLLPITCFLLPATAQQQIPDDPKMRVGHLDNGLTYILRHNERPKQQADFYIAQKVGSILEDDNQRGLAHFLEHMCFNGTKHFPGKAMINYLESIGVKFGANLNAYTSIDETVYNISSAPVKREGVVDSCLMILADWSCGLTLDKKEIDAERGVIHEEWRTRNNAQLRMMDQVLPRIYQGEKYAYRMPIGIMEVVDNFKPKALRDYYKKWYRPDQQCVIVVGDIDVDKVEQKIKALFSGIKMPAKAAERTYVPVSDNKEPIVCIARDKEQPSTQFSIFFKHDPMPVEQRHTDYYYAMSYASNMVQMMLNERLGEMAKKPGCPFLGASVGYGDFWLSQNKEAFTGSVGCKEDSVLSAMRVFSAELERARRYGFTAGEYARAKANYLQGYERSYAERENQLTDGYSKEYVRYFTKNEPSAGIEMEYQIAQALTASMPLEMINEMAKTLSRDNENLVIVMFGPEKNGDKAPALNGADGEKALLAAYMDAKNQDIAAFVDDTPQDRLMEELPAPGTIVKEEAGKFGCTVLTLSNGVRVVVKATDFKADEISMSAFSDGGTSLFDTKDRIQYSVMNNVVALGGVSKFSNEQLSKMLAGVNASADTSVGSLSEGASGNSSVKDFEAMLQLNYLNFTAPRKDMDAYNSFLQRMRVSMERQANLPQKALRDSINVAMYNNHPRAAQLTVADIDKIDYDRCIEMYRDRFADASDFTFVFVGNIDLEKARPLFCQYLASLPAISRKESWRDNKVLVRKGQYQNVFSRKLETEKATVIEIRTADIEYTSRNAKLMYMLSQALNTIYLEEVREKAGGTYGVQVGGGISMKPRAEATLQIQFDTDPARREEMTKIVDDQLQNFITTGPTEESLAKIKEFMLKSYAQSQRENGYWMNSLCSFYADGIDSVSDYEKTVSSITCADVRDFAKRILDQGNTIEVSMTSGE